MAAEVRSRLCRAPAGEERARHVLLCDEMGQLTLIRLRSWHRLSALCTSAGLDRQLAAGLQPETSVRLAVRATQLTSMAFRRDLAAGLHRILAASRQPLAAVGPLSVAPRLPRLPLCRAQITQSAPALAELAGYLAAPGLVRVQGVAMVSQLVTDAAGPLYCASGGDDVAEIVARLLGALTP